MKKYQITVNGKMYEVEVEEVSSTQDVSASAPAPRPVTKPASAPTPKPAAAPKVATVVSAGDTAVDAPMPGTVLEVHVSVGDRVSAGQVLLILEAMKMENEIMAPKAGVVRAIPSAKGVSVNTGDPLVIIE